MSDRVFYSATALLALLIVGLAVVWPQGEGRRSPGPFGRPEVTPSYVAAQKRKAEAKAREQLGVPGKPAAKAAPPEGAAR